MVKLKKPAFLSDEVFRIFLDIADNQDYQPAINLLEDSDYARCIWKEFKDSDIAGDFALEIINSISVWQMRDVNSPNENYVLHQKALNYLGKLEDVLAQSGALMFNYQLCFERAVRKAHEERSEFEDTDIPNMWNIHFIGLLQKMKNDVETFEKRDFEKDASLYPRKIKEKSAFRTYFAGVLHAFMIQKFEKSRYSVIADILHIMFPDEDPLDETHVRKLVQ